jgi:D-alanine transaminase
MDVYLNGAYVPKDRAVISVDDRGFLFGDGVYEVVRNYSGHIFELDAHLARLERGLRELRMTGVDAWQFGDIALELLRRADLADTDAVVYIQVTRGAAPRRHWFPDAATPATTYAAALPFTPKGDPVNGIAVITVPDIRWARCDIKSVNLLPNCLASQRAQESGAVEALFVRDGMALEASASSLFAVIEGTVWTAPKTNYILPSVTRGVVLDICRTHDIPHTESPIPVERLRDADEVFLAGTTLEVMPVVRIDDDAVGAGRPGDVTAGIARRFAARTAALAERV